MFTAKAYAYLIGGIVVCGLVLVLAISLRINGEQRATIRDQKRELAAASKALTQAADDIERFAARAGVSAAEAARICGVEGSTAFDRGVAFGAATCPVSQ